MNQETIENEVNGLSDQNTNTNNKSISKEASKTYNIKEEMPSISVFGYPKLDEFLNNQKLRTGVLTEVEFVTGKYGECVALKLDGIWYRSSSKPIIEETTFLKEKNLFPCEVFVAEKKGESGRTYYTLRGGEDE